MKYGVLRFDNDSWVLSKVMAHVAIRLKQLFPKIPKYRADDYCLTNTPETCLDLEWFTQRYPFQVSNEDQDYLVNRGIAHQASLADVEALFAPGYTPRALSFVDGLAPRIYQSQGAELLAKVRRLLIGDQVGLGKTVVAIAAMAMNEIQKPICVVVQAHLQGQWKRMIHQFLGNGVAVHPIQGTKPYTLPEADVYLLKYSCLSGWVNTINAPQTAEDLPLFCGDQELLSLGWFKSLIFDEVQEVRRSDSAKHRAAKAFSQVADFVLGLSATPVYNYGDEVFNVLEVIRPGSLGTWDEFKREWGSGGRFSKTQYNGTRVVVEDPKALGSYLRTQHLFLRRTREDVKKEMPPVNKIVEEVDYDKAKVDEAERVARALSQKVIHGSFAESGQAGRELDAKLRKYTGLAKARHVAAFVRIMVEGGEPVLLAGWHRDVYEIWNDVLADLNPAMFTGSESAKQKEESKRRFSEGETDLMFISLRSGIGLDGLQQRCKVVVIGELDWSPQVHEQLIGRIYRDGQEGQVTAIFMVCDFGADPVMVDVLGLKASQANSIVDPGNKDEPLKGADRSRIRALAENYISKPRAAPNA